MIEQFENMTIRQLKKMTEDYEKISDLLWKYKTKYPHINQEIEKELKEETAEEIVEGVK